MATPLPPIRALQVFEAVARHGTVSAAAQELAISPSAVSQQLRALEAILQVSLFERRGRGVALTTWGTHYAAGLASAFGQIRGTHRRLADIARGARLVVSCLPSLAGKWLSPLLIDWTADAPGASVRLLAAEREAPLDDMLDFRVTYGEAGRAYTRHLELFRDWVSPACAPGLLSELRPKHPRDLLDGPLLHVEWDQSHRPPPDWTDFALRLGAGAAARAPALTLSLSSAAIEAAVNGRGIVLGQGAMIAQDVAAGRLVCPFDLRLALPEPYYLAWHTGAFDKPLGRELHGFLQSEGRRLRGAAIGAGDIVPRTLASGAAPGPA
ncbi:MAG: LysR family transcriptional regulator [Rhodobacteraceae bacterium]|nr:LysR family transcriptional regulator [Paracoccaceae bacterium]